MPKTKLGEGHEVIFKEWKCVTTVGHYSPAGTAIRLIGAPGTEYEGEPIGTATVNIHPEMYHPDDRKLIPFSKDLPENQCYIKTWSENEGMVMALVKAGIVKQLGKIVPVGGYGEFAPLVEILK